MDNGNRVSVPFNTVRPAVFYRDAMTSRHVSTYIDRPLKEVYDYASDPANLPEWAPGLCSSVDRVDGRWVAESPMGRIVLDWAPPNEFGVLDHHVTVESGETFYNPMRVTADGTGCEVVFSVRRQPGMTDGEFDRDANAVLADLVALKRRVEGA
ncbi:SRPBCC family protein [Virgisporangium ochraceum]|uniref:Polyketide cyclase n=2 Tax=Virgisporangium ochraceum TaxID=65505 RepID=A0A8J3ZQV6_9ACTN|nr:polyketide cyclase [Virgisporangium ochraceum]